MRHIRSFVIAVVALTAAAFLPSLISAQSDMSLSRRAPVSCPTTTPYPFYNATVTATHPIVGWYCTATEPVVFNGSTLTATAAELNFNHTAASAGTAVASKTAVLGAYRNIDYLSFPAGGLHIGTNAGTSVTATAAELNVLHSVTAGTAAASSAAVLGSGRNLDFLQFGATTTAALTHGGGTDATPLSTSAAGSNFLAYYTKSTATSGDSRGLYLKHRIMGAGGSGEAARFLTLIDDVAVAVGGTVNGAHIGLEVTSDGSISGTANALRATYMVDASGAPGGLSSVVQADTYFDTSAVIPADFAFLHLDNVGVAPTTNGVPLLMNILNPNTSTMFVSTSGTGSGECAQTGGIVASKALKISVGGTPYWIPLCTAR